MSQSPYKGFNRILAILTVLLYICLNPPIRGSIDNQKQEEVLEKESQSPYKGFNRTR